jgi:uncharacterized protein
MIRLGVVADTHIPDRLPALPQSVLTALDGVDAILHCGDVSTQGVLDQLSDVAPVHAVWGNRDWRLRLPADRVLEFGGVRLGLTHGHGGWRSYLVEKLLYVTVGFHTSRYLRRVQAHFRDRDVQAVVFGHSHWPANQVVDGILYFNPGSVAPTYFSSYGPAVGRLTIEAGSVRGEILPLREQRNLAARRAQVPGA